jgi:hypothetical protein
MPFIVDHELKEYCDQIGRAFETVIQSRTINVVGPAIFPGDEIDSGPDGVNQTIDFPTDQPFSPIVLFCVDYGWNVEIRRHQTAQAFHFILPS